MRPPLSSRMNSRPGASLRPDPGFDFEFVARTSLTMFSFRSWTPTWAFAATSLHIGGAPDLSGRCRFHALGEIRRPLLQECRQRFLCVFRTYARTELFVLGFHCCLDLLDKRSLH